MKRYLHIIYILGLLLIVGGITHNAWAAKVTYHILTLPINNSIYHMKDAVSGHRLEALKIVVDNQTQVELPAHYKSPLATGFTYYKPDDITKGGSAISLYDNVADCKGILYDVKASPTPSPVAEGTAINTATAEYYVIYTYNSSNTIAKLDGTVNYNIGVKNKGFLSLNRGRNNRPAVIPTAKADPEMLASEDFSYVKDPGNNIGTYWQSGDNKNKQEDVGSQFFFGFKFEGVDPYNIIIRTSYNRNITFIEKNEGTSNFVYKWYKEAALMAGGTANAYLASDDHIKYSTVYNSSIDNPTNPAYDTQTGYFHGNKQTWGTVALLNNTTNNGYVFIGTRNVDVSGNVPGPTNDNKYYYLTFDGYNNLKFTQNTAANATTNHTMDGIYPLKKVTFKIATPFYAVEPTDAHIISVSDVVSQYTVDNDPIETKYLPSSLKRKYCNYTGKFYSDAACTNEITKFSQATDDPTEGYQVYIGYELTSDIPFKGITPVSTYDASTWAGATWYELTDAASTQFDGLKLKYDGTNFKNNGADNVYDKTTEFAFIGDPYELRVVYRNTTSDNTVQYVGATGTPPTTGTLFTASTTASEGYKWELPDETTVGSFLLRKYKDDGYWYWNPGHPSPVAISYSTKAHTYNVATANAQVVTFNISDLGYTEGDYITVTKGGTNADQVTVTSEKIYVQEGGTASFTAAIKGRGDSDKTFTLTIQKYNSSDVAQGTASVVTVNQNNSSLTANTVEYSTASSTRVKVMTLPTRDFTYNIVDKSGRIAVKATATQTIFSPLSLASIPSIIVSPFLYSETITFYSSYSGGGRGNLSSQITELTAGDASSSTNVYVKYTTSALDGKPIKLSENQELNVQLNGQYVYYNKSTDKLETNENPTSDELSSSVYLWKLRNRDPYAMLIDNMGAREDLSVTGSEDVTIYNDNGGTTTESRQKGAWVTLESIVNEGELTFTKRRSSESEGSGAIAQQFIAKASLQDGVYEVMVADGGSEDASTTYYNIGRPAANTVKIYDQAHYAHGKDELRFVLNQNVTYTYHLIDKAKHELLTATSKTPDLALPAEYQSPLVGTYHFYARDQITIDESKTPHEYTPLDPATKYITDLTGLNATYTIYDSSEGAYTGTLTATDETDMKSQADKLTSLGDYYYKIGSTAPYTYKKVTVTRGYQGTDIYVTYDANDIVKFNDGSYMLKFLDSNIPDYYLEDGNDKLTTTQKQPVYPYCNGDGNLNVYDDGMQKEQFNGGASTRPRWIWYFASENSDPYHVSIRSKSTISYNGISNPTYLTTYVVHFNQDAEGVNRVVTGGTLPGVASVDPTEYMVLGTEGKYKLLTTKEINDGTTTGRRKVTSLEQYWKTYNMIKLHVLGINKNTDAYSDDPTTWVVPEGKRAELKSKLVERLKLTATNDDNLTTKINALTSTGIYFYRVGTSTYTYKKVTVTNIPASTLDTDYTIDNCSESDWGGANYVDGWIWHSYKAYANATRWNGYNDKTNGAGKKVVENIEHWFQTFDMGDGTFDIENAEVAPVLVLLDRHGWEIMRRPLPAAATYPEGEELKALRVYDSPLVDKYYFYSNATKASGCHKYTLRLNDDKTERDQIKVNGVHYSSSSLANLPPATATGVKSGSAFNDQFVIYTVKEEYENNYAYDLTLDEENKTFTETGTSQPYLVLQNGRFYKAENTLNKTSNPSYISKPISEHTDPEGGNVYDLIVSPHNHGGTNNNIIDGSGNFIGNNFWYVKPNLNIDDEMGIPWIQTTGEETVDDAKYKLREDYKDKTGFDPYNIQLQLVKNNSGEDDGRYLTTHMTSAHLNNGILVGDYSGGGTTKITLAAAGSATVASGTSEGYDHTDMRITNQTFMAVSDVNGNMQIMPRFDHTLRVDLENVQPWESVLSEPKDHAKASADDNDSMGPQTTFFVCPQRFHYHIIDNYGREALRYKRGADFYPAITDHFKSPVAKDFTYYCGLATKSGAITESNSSEWGSATGVYKRTLTNESMLADVVKRLPKTGTYYFKIGTGESITYKKVTVTEALIEDSEVGEWGPATGEFKRTLTKESMLADAVKLLPTAGTYYYRIGTRGVFTYKKVTVTGGLLDKQITGSFAEANVDGVDCNVYVRYEYDLDADLDADRMLQGQWYTVKLANKDLQADGKVMTFTSTVADDDAYDDAKDALSSDGVYYFRIGTSSYTYKKVTVASSGASKTEDDSSESAWTNALGLGVDLYAGEISLIAEDDDEYEEMRDALTATGDYYFRIGTTEPYTYKKVTVNAVSPSLDYDEDTDDGTKGYDTNWSNSKPLVVDADAKKWQWKFFVAPADPTSDYYVEPDPYAIHLFNRYSNYTTNPSEEPSPMSVEIKVPNADDGANRFVLLQHPSGGYALAVAKTYSDYNYLFLNGEDMTTSVAATTETEAGFTYKSGGISNGSRVVVEKDVKHNYTYYVITNANELAITAAQTAEEAETHGYNPYVPEVAQSPLLNMDDYLYYGFAARPAGKYSVIPQTILYTLSGLYDDDVYVRYNAYSMDKTSFKVPNKKTTDGGHVARDPESVDVSMNLNGGLPYNIVWYDNDMMQSTDDATVSDGGNHALSGNKGFVWYFTGNDPYALKIKHKGGSYLNGTGTMVAEGSAPTFMLLRKSGYDYGILQKTNGTDRLSGYGQTTTTGDPTQYIIFGLSIHKLKYHLIIAKTCPDKDHPNTGEYVDIPYRTTESGTLSDLRIYGTTQRDLTSVNDGEGTHYAGEKYQLGSTLSWNNPVQYHTYSYDAGSVSIGDELVVPNVFYRPNCTFDFYIEGIYQHYAEASANEGKPYDAMEAKYKGLKLTRLMSDDHLIDQDVVVNIVYSFDKTVATNTGLGFVTSTGQNLWYTFETQDGDTPYLAQYTNAWGLQSKEGRDTRYTNDYLWTPLGDVYGFKMYNRYMLKNSTGGEKTVMTMSAITEGQKLLLAKPSTTEEPTDYPAGYEIFELVTGDAEGYFRVHPVDNNSGTRYYVRRYDDTSDEDIDDDGKSDLNYTILSATPCDWKYGLEMDLLEPYYERAGYVGGLTATAKTAYKTEIDKGEGKYKITDLQNIVYSDANIIHFTSGYYRLHNQPGVSSIDPVRYASGYLHEIERDQDKNGNESDAIPMHFYSKEGITTKYVADAVDDDNALNSGFTVSNATRGQIPIASTEMDPSTIFYINGGVTENNTISEATMSTQGLNVSGNKMTVGNGLLFTFIDIGGATFLITDVLAPASRQYFNFDQTSNIYDIKFAHEVPTDDAKWCLQPVQKTAEAGNGEMPLQIATNQGGDGHYYATFYAPFDVLLPDDVAADPSKEITAKNYYAYYCKTWDNAGLHPTAVPATNTYAEGKFVPAGTPVIIRTTDESNVVTLTLPSTSPTISSITTDLKGTYLEQLLTLDSSHDAYTMGLPFTSANVTIDRSTGVVTAPLVESATTGVGFYINATPNKEHDALQSLWQRNNRYVLHNKIYYRAPAVSSAKARKMSSMPQFVPVIFDDDELEEEFQDEEQGQQMQEYGDGVYDLSGRKVANEEQVQDGTWRQRLSPGIYIVQGKKIKI